MTWRAELDTLLGTLPVATVDRARLDALFDDLDGSLDPTGFTSRDTAIAGDLEILAAPSEPVALEAPSTLQDASAAAPTPLPPRYEDLGLLGRGGLGEVRRVRDRDLGRVVALKILAHHAVGQPGLEARFLEEAQVTAQLVHPGIVPVHEVGRLADGRLFYTMMEVRGLPLSARIAEVHEASPGTTWERTASGWTFRKLVTCFARVCEAIDFAHARGVLHRDLKPDNIVVGDHGEVYVVDWGLAKILEATGPSAGDPGPEAVQSERSSSDAHATRAGAVAGTPAYMAPEQARGAVGHLDRRTDVYGLGTILYEMLAGRPPYAGASAAAVLAQVIAGPPPPPGPAAPALGHLATLHFDEPEPAALTGPPLPQVLVDACMRALSPDPGDRYPDTGAIGAVVASWLDGTERRRRATRLVAEAAALGPDEADSLRARAAELDVEGAALLSDVEPWEAPARKAPGWALEDEAAALRREAESLRQRAERLLQAALVHAPDLPEARAGLLDLYRWEHARAERLRDTRATARAELLIRTHAARLPPGDPSRRAAVVYLRGMGALTLVTDPPGAEARLFRFVLENRRLVPGPGHDLGRTPLHSVPLAPGSWLVELSAPGRETVRYPVAIRRADRWDGVPPGGAAPRPVFLPRAGELAPDTCYVPAGWCRIGGDPEAPGSLPAERAWVDGFVMRRFPVTNADYTAFLDDLVAHGREDEALRFVPREVGKTGGEAGAAIFGRDEAGRFVLRPDADGDVWLAGWPVLMIDLAGTRAFAAWSAERSGLGWRLPSEREWEKAARGVDGRGYPWGDWLDPSWCCMADSHPGPALPAEVHAFPVDESVYGVRGLAGNWCEWTADRFGSARQSDDGTPAPGDLHAVRGGDFWKNAAACRSAARAGYEASERYAGSVRLVRSLEG